MKKKGEKGKEKETKEKKFVDEGNKISLSLFCIFGFCFFKH